MKIDRRVLLKGTAAFAAAMPFRASKPTYVTGSRFTHTPYVLQTGNTLEISQYHTVKETFTHLCTFRADKTVIINRHEIFQFGDQQICYFYDDRQSYCKAVSMENPYLLDLDGVLVGVFTYNLQHTLIV